MDVRHMDMLTTGAFNLVIDKGTMDSIHGSTGSIEDVHLMNKVTCVESYLAY
jgi:hypothetical protein